MLHPLRLYGLLWHQKEGGLALGAVLGVTGRPLVVLTDDCLEGAIGGMRDGRKKRKRLGQIHSLGFLWPKLILSLLGGSSD